MAVLTGIVRSAVLALAVPVLAVGPALAEPVTFRIEVAGLACPFCAFGVEKELQRIDGVETVEIDAENELIFVTLRDGDALDAARVETALRAAEDRVREAVATSGFALEGLARVDD